jgi:hypothetical protein
VEAPRREQDAADEVVERDVVVARDREPGRLERVEEPAGAAELAGAGALRQVPADDDELRADLVEGGQQRLDGARGVTAEVDVRDVREDYGCTVRQRRVRRRCPG